MRVVTYVYKTKFSTHSFIRRNKHQTQQKGNNMNISPSYKMLSRPVSYTHLDVYKRQDIYRVFQNKFEIRTVLKYFLVTMFFLIKKKKNFLLQQLVLEFQPRIFHLTFKCIQIQFEMQFSSLVFLFVASEALYTLFSYRHYMKPVFNPYKNVFSAPLNN